VGKTRLEAFSDGVLAVAITLLVLDLHVDAGGSLGAQLRHDWPSFAAYVLSFFIIGVIWVNHHALFALAARVDRPLLFYNLLLLMWVTTIPFTTSTLASFLRSGGSDTRWAVVLYGISMEGMAISFTLILAYLLRHQLVVRPVSRAEGRAAVRRFGLGTLVYPAVMLIGLVWPIVMLVVYGALTVYYIVEQTPILPGELREATP
jgi:TMEM175 potassium channel family protein